MSKTILRSIVRSRMFGFAAAVAVVLVLAFAGFMFQAWRETTRPGAGLARFERSDQLSDEYNDYSSWLENDLMHQRTPWTTEQADRLVAILDRSYTDEERAIATRKGATMKDNEPLLQFSFTEAAISLRLRHNDPIEHEARRMLIDALLARLDDPMWEIRLQAVADVVGARLPLDPAIRNKIESMMEDPNAQVASNARNQLQNFDEIERLRAEGKWRERGIDYAVRKP